MIPKNDIPPESLVETSWLLMLSGGLILASVTILVAFLMFSRGRDAKGNPDVFGKLVTVNDVTSRYKTTWTPGAFWPSKLSHGNDRSGSVLFGAVWVFLCVWLGFSGVYLVIAGAMVEIEVFREHAHLRAAGLVALACCLCAVWPILVRIGAHPNSAQTDQAPLKKMQGVQGVPPRRDATSGVWLWIACVVLAIAWVLALVASAELQPWSLPGPQYGTLLFLAPGYGLFTGWLLYAAFLNAGVAMNFYSYPEGTVAPSGDSKYADRGSVFPLIAAAIVAASSIAIPDPAQPLPMAVALLLFTPKYTTNLVAGGIALVASAIAAWRVYELWT